jgi:glyceraldehyde 3-phosphate dehydrogenase
MAYMLKYDTVHGMLPDDITVEGDTLVVNGRRVIVTAYMDPVHTYTQNTLYRS